HCFVILCGFGTVSLHTFSSSPSSSQALKCNFGFTLDLKSVAAVLFPPVESCRIKEFHFITLIFASPKTTRKVEMEETSMYWFHFFLLLLLLLLLLLFPIFVFFICFLCTLAFFLVLALPSTMSLYLVYQLYSCR
ncbi:hypothetical protein TSMEX_000102, partial [Taenia solium]